MNLRQESINFRRNHALPAKLWIQYLDFIVTLKMYIKAERIGNWTMQLECTRKMLNFFLQVRVM